MDDGQRLVIIAHPELWLRWAYTWLRTILGCETNSVGSETTERLSAGWITVDWLTYQVLTNKKVRQKTCQQKKIKFGLIDFIAFFNTKLDRAPQKNLWGVIHHTFFLWCLIQKPWPCKKKEFSFHTITMNQKQMKFLTAMHKKQKRRHPILVYSETPLTKKHLIFKTIYILFTFI